MHQTAMFMISLLAFLFNFHAVCAYVYIGFPFDQQLPNVARIGETYEFAINSQTFKSDNPENNEITYEAFQLPSWLTFNSQSLTFTGSPTIDDPTGNINFILQGTDINNSLNQSCIIYLSDQPSPQMNPQDSVQMQLQNFGNTNGFSGLVLEPQHPFSFSFNKETFIVPSSSNNQIVAYYGKSANRTSLPSWCFFDESTLTFSGTTPPVNALDAPSLQFDLTLIATDYAGFSAAYSTFRIVVGGHTLYIHNSTSYTKTVMTNAGESVTIDLPIDDIYLDNTQIQPSQISEVVAYNAPDWVTVVDNTKLVANVPADQTDNLVVNVTLFDIYQDSVYMNFGINVVHDIFSVDNINNVTATPGELFEYTIPDSYFKNRTATDITAAFTETWLTFYHSNNTFIGMVPTNFEVASIELEATMDSLSQKLTFFIVSDGRTSSSSSLSQISSRTSSQISSQSSSRVSSRASSTQFNSYSSMATSTRSSSVSSSIITSTAASSSASSLVIIPASKSTNSNKKGLAIGLGVGIPVFAIIVAALIFFFCCCGKRRKNGNGNDNDNGDLSRGMEKNGTNDTLVMKGASAALAQKNLADLEKNGNDQMSYYSNTQSTLTDKSESSFYHDANNQVSTDQLLGGGLGGAGAHATTHIGANDSEILNSWRQSIVGGFKTRDSLSSLATVATSDLLTVNVVNDDKVRKSQMILPKRSTLRTSSSDSINHNSSQYSSNLEPLRETDDNNVYEGNNFSRDTSYGTMSTEAQLVGFNNSGSLYRNEQPEQQSYRGELSSISGDENDFRSASSNHSDNYSRNRL